MKLISQYLIRMAGICTKCLAICIHMFHQSTLNRYQHDLCRSSRFRGPHLFKRYSSALPQCVFMPRLMYKGLDGRISHSRGKGPPLSAIDRFSCNPLHHPARKRADRASLSSPVRSRWQYEIYLAQVCEPSRYGIQKSVILAGDSGR
jgi:hypothetical protein